MPIRHGSSSIAGLKGLKRQLYNSAIMDVQYNEVPATELREHASEIVSRVAFGGEEVVLTRRGKPIAALVSLEVLKALHRLEDAEDAAQAERARKDVRKRGAVAWGDVKSELRRT